MPDGRDIIQDLVAHSSVLALALLLLMRAKMFDGVDDE